jgi:hypothetical protein
VIAALLGIGIVLFLAGGCDGGGSKRDSQYQQLVGTWRIQRLDLGRGPINVQDTVFVEFLQADDARSYRIIRAASRDTTRTGRVYVPRSNALRMIGGFDGALLWHFDFEEPEDVSTSVRFQLQSASEESVQAFLGAIGVGGSTQALVVDLDFESE